MSSCNSLNLVSLSNLILRSNVSIRSEKIDTGDIYQKLYNGEIFLEDLLPEQLEPILYDFQFYEKVLPDEKYYEGSSDLVNGGNHINLCVSIYWICFHIDSMTFSQKRKYLRRFDDLLTYYDISAFFYSPQNTRLRKIFIWKIMNSIHNEKEKDFIMKCTDVYSDTKRSLFVDFCFENDFSEEEGIKEMLQFNSREKEMVKRLIVKIIKDFGGFILLDSKM